MLDQALLVLRRIDLPDFLQADAEFRGFALGIKRELRDELLGQAAARAFGEQSVLAAQLHAARVGSLVRTILGDTHVAGRNAAHGALVVVEDLNCRETRIDLDAKRFGLGRKPTTKHAKRTDIAV